MANVNETTSGQVIEDTVVPAGQPWSAELRKGDTVRIIDSEGRQVVDFLCCNLADRAERYNAANTIKLNNIYLKQGTVL
jgi:uncharacterized protein YcgI (DUF1989 family)